ncbi:energy transducer TonB [Acidithiobacillus sp. 'AMD consortium']|uniref:Energy transducer TonB n=2 Tax=Acidithiobacillus ferridurans TaxID=1232575 RepID=A0A8X8KCT1_ACIFI|nr:MULTISPECIES: energy transducer TonB [Acidithiobacillus]MBU2715035.1 energy transducer TonB [Acidithiobacillus ferridurans]MBU2724493.1 energy transducer TonB [Acidithiobacillus ferridurans]MBU2725618.1 energy transducer TonB [Acidithiobacillus ferridurans]QFG78007.1 energy transducer TonB [Acidithiobacillus sp. 'AMD consortium']BBF65783.1 Filamentous hemagglutinin [Acidithiobacillus ferridurans]
MTTTMPRIANNALMPEPKERHFKYAVGGAVVVEALLVLGLIWYGHSTPPVKAVKPKEHVIAVQMVTLPQPSPKVVPKPLPKPVPPKPVVHHVPPPPPRPHPKVVIPPKQPAPTPPAPPVKQVTPPKPVPMPAPKPVVTPPPAPPPMSAQQTASMMGRYVGMVRPIIQQSLRVPAELRAMGLSGKATVEFEISPSGQLLWAKIIKPSPLGAVNRAALAAIQKGGFPPFLKKMPKQNTVFQIDVKVGAGSN